jgi:cytochrome oxidase Cu insertion factor (SCO1/SenC/PrrC family)
MAYIKRKTDPLSRTIYKKDFTLKRHVFIGIVILGIFMAASFFVADYIDLKKSAFSNPISNSIAEISDGKTYGQAKVGGHFELVDHTGAIRTEADFKGKYLLVYFGYSFCPDICPAALYNISQALQHLNEKTRRQIQPLFISVDPERDTVETLRIYMENYHPAFVALTGTPAQVDQALKAYRVYAKKATPDGTSTEYLIDHSSVVYVMDRQGRYVTSFNHTTEPEKIVQILQGVIR